MNRTHMMPLGRTQRDVLNALVDHEGWHRGCGWVWDTPGRTENIIKTLVDRGLARCETEHYTATEMGRAIVEDKP